LNILFLSHRFPYPPKDGAKIRAFYVIKHLTEVGHRVTVASMVRSDEEAAEASGLAPHAHEILVERVDERMATLRMIGRLPTRTPSSMGYFYSKELAKRIGRTLSTQKFDLIFVYCSSVAQYVDATERIPMMLDFGDMDSQKWLSYGTFKPFPLSLGYFVEGLKLQLAEAELARKFDTCLATTPAEIKTLEGYLTGCRTGWFANGVDAERFKPGGEPYDPDTICFVGRMDYYPNQKAMIDFCSDVLPRVRDKRSSAKLVIVGAEPSREVKKLGEIPGVTVTGSVPEVQPFVKKAALTVAPLTIARGTQNKILESLAMGVPVVASSLSAGGVDAVAEEHLLVADRPEDQARQILRILGEPPLRDRLARAGRERMLTHHDWARSMTKLDGIIAETMEEYPRA
jgi:polysaccharide biosynthesis protein PslH